jgi:predicted transcriptional regulator
LSTKNNLSKTLTIEVAPGTDALRELGDISKAPHVRRDTDHGNEVYFASIEAVRNFLTRERMALLRAIRSRHPGSIYELAKMVNRNLKSVQTDLKVLEEHGLVRLNARQRTARRHVKVPESLFGEIALRIAI